MEIFQKSMDFFQKTMDFFQKNSHVFRISSEKIERAREKRQNEKKEGIYQKTSTTEQIHVKNKKDSTAETENVKIRSKTNPQ